MVKRDDSDRPVGGLGSQRPAMQLADFFTPFGEVEQLQDEIHGKCTRPKGDTVADKVRRVLTQYDTLAKPVSAEPGEEVNYIIFGILRWDDFQQFQITRRVEEMCPHKVLAEALRAPPQ